MSRPSEKFVFAATVLDASRSPLQDQEAPTRAMMLLLPSEQSIYLATFGILATLALDAVESPAWCRRACDSAQPYPCLRYHCL